MGARSSNLHEVAVIFKENVKVESLLRLIATGKGKLKLKLPAVSQRIELHLIHTNDESWALRIPGSCGGIIYALDAASPDTFDSARKDLLRGLTFVGPSTPVLLLYLGANIPSARRGDRITTQLGVNALLRARGASDPRWLAVEVSYSHNETTMAQLYAALTWLVDASHPVLPPLFRHGSGMEAVVVADDTSVRTQSMRNQIAAVGVNRRSRSTSYAIVAQALSATPPRDPDDETDDDDDDDETDDDDAPSTVVTAFSISPFRPTSSSCSNAGYAPHHAKLTRWEASSPTSTSSRDSDSWRETFPSACEGDIPRRLSNSSSSFRGKPPPAGGRRSISRFTSFNTAASLSSASIASHQPLTQEDRAGGTHPTYVSVDSRVGGLEHARLRPERIHSNRSLVPDPTPSAFVKPPLRVSFSESLVVDLLSTVTPSPPRRHSESQQRASPGTPSRLTVASSPSRRGRRTGAVTARRQSSLRRISGENESPGKANASSPPSIVPSSPIKHPTVPGTVEPDAPQLASIQLFSSAVQGRPLAPLPENVCLAVSSSSSSSPDHEEGYSFADAPRRTSDPATFRCRHCCEVFLSARRLQRHRRRECLHSTRERSTGSQRVLDSATASAFASPSSSWSPSLESSRQSKLLESDPLARLASQRLLR